MSYPPHVRQRLLEIARKGRRGREQALTELAAQEDKQQTLTARNWLDALVSELAAAELERMQSPLAQEASAAVPMDRQAWAALDRIENELAVADEHGMSATIQKLLDDANQIDPGFEERWWRSRSRL